MESRYAEIVCLPGPCSRTNLFIGMVDIRDENNTLSPVLLRVDRFRDERRMAREVRSVEWALRLGFLWLVTQDDSNLSTSINALIIVIVQLRSGNAITCEHKRRIGVRAVGKSERHEIFINLECGSVDLQLIIRSKLGAGRHLESLEIRVVIAHWPKSPRPKLRGDVIRGLIQLG